MSDAFSWQEGFSRPNWDLIRQLLKKEISPVDLAEAWSEVARQWARRIRDDLGGAYNVRVSPEFILVSPLETDAADKLLIFAEETLVNIYQSLGKAAWRDGLGRHMILLFSEEDDYYQYVSYYYPEGHHPTSGGCLIGCDYVHIAMNTREGKWSRAMLTHELFHNCVVHLPLPTWLNEGLAQHFDRSAQDYTRPVVDHDLKERHLTFWNEENIQRFWAGISFREPGEPCGLSYNLSEILLNLLITEPKSLQAFVQQAEFNDAGQTAALECLGIDLGEALASFLGEGDSRPKRKAIAQLFEECRKPR